MSSSDISVTDPRNCVSQFLAIRARVDAAADAAKRRRDDITIVAVSKQHGAETVAPLAAYGHGDFGENRVQEAQSKWPDLRAAHPGVTLHLIGPLQTNKVAQAVDLFDAIHSVDRPKLAAKLGAELQARQKSMQLFVQVNTGEESQKAGVLPGAADDFITQCRDEFGLSVDGLMCIPPVDEEAALHFALLAKIAERNDCPLLSMGMSDDFEKAIAYGATHVRVGSAIFGPRAVRA